jgi:chemotaxis protein methyltransferase CheR
MASPNPIGEIFSEDYRFLQQSVYSHVGIVFEGDKRYLFEGRLAPIIRQLGLRSINELCSVLQAGNAPHIGRMVAEAMTTNETYFFREPAHYDLIRAEFLPRMRQERAGFRKLRFWSAASSTGQEAYSLAMLLAEEGMAGWDIQILGTDFSSKVVAQANSGLYQQLEVNRGLPAPLLVKYFRQQGRNWQLVDEIRRMARFQTIDLRNDVRDLGPFDLVFCRNVMIYFDAETKRKIMRALHSTLVRGGWLLLGGAETTIGFEDLFEKRRIREATVFVAR